MCIPCEERIEHWLDIYEELLFLERKTQRVSIELLFIILDTNCSRKEHNLCCLFQTVADAFAVHLRDLLWGEVGGEDGRQLMLVSVGDDVDDGTELPFRCSLAIICRCKRLLSHAEIFKYVAKHLVGGYFANNVAEVVDAFAEVLTDKVAREVLVEAIDYLLDTLKR